MASKGLRASALASMVREDEVVTLLLIDRDDMAPDPNQPRKDFPDESLRELGSDLKNAGQDIPLLVRENPAGTPPFLIFDGERRWRSSAPEFGDIRQLQAKVYRGDINPDHVLDRQFLINFHSEQMSLRDQARYMRRKVELEGSVKAVAEKLHIGQARIYKILGAMEAEGIAGQVRDEGLTKDAETISTVAAIERQSPAAAEQLVKNARAAGRLTRKAAADAAKSVRAAKAPGDPGSHSQALGAGDGGGHETGESTAPGAEMARDGLDARYQLVKPDRAPVVLVNWRGQSSGEFFDRWQLLKRKGASYLCLDRKMPESEQQDGLVLVEFGNSRCVAPFPAVDLLILSVALHARKS